MTTTQLIDSLSTNPCHTDARDDTMGFSQDWESQGSNLFRLSRQTALIGIFPNN